MDEFDKKILTGLKKASKSILLKKGIIITNGIFRNKNDELDLIVTPYTNKKDEEHAFKIFKEKFNSKNIKSFFLITGGYVSKLKEKKETIMIAYFNKDYDKIGYFIPFERKDSKIIFKKEFKDDFFNGRIIDIFKDDD